MNNVLSWGYMNFYDATDHQWIIDHTDLQLLNYINSGRDTCFSNNGGYYASIGDASDTRFKLGLFNTSTWNHVVGNTEAVLAIDSESPFYNTSALYQCAFSVNSQYFAYTYSASPFFKVLDTTNNYTVVTGIPTITSATSGSGSIQFSPNGTWMAISNPGGTRLTLWTLADWTKVVGTPSFTATEAPILAFSANSVWLAVGYDVAPYLSIYTTSDWVSVINTPSLSYKVQCCAFSPNNNYLAVGCYDALKVYATIDWSSVTISFPTNGVDIYHNLQEIAFSSDGSFMAAVFIPLPINGVAQRRLLIYETTTWTIVLDSSIDSSSKLGLSWNTAELVYKISGTVVGYNANDIKLLSMPKETWQRKTNVLDDTTLSGRVNYAGLVEGFQMTQTSGIYTFSYLFNRDRIILAFNLADTEKRPLVFGKITPVKEI